MGSADVVLSVLCGVLMFIGIVTISKPIARWLDRCIDKLFKE